MKRRAALLLLSVLAAAPLHGDPPPGSLWMEVRETAGLRRFGYPVVAEIPFPRGAVRRPAEIQLQSGGAPLKGVQCEARSRWPDGSVQWACLSFNLSPAPLEKLRIRLVYGPGVESAGAGQGVVTEDDGELVVRGVYHLPRTGPGFLSSIRYGAREYLAAPAEISVKSRSGSRLSEGRRRWRTVSPGPVNAVVELSGVFHGERSELPYRLTVSLPNSKSWFDAVLQVDDPRNEVGEILLTVPYRLEGQTTLYDFGVGSWVYGQLRAAEVARLEQRGRSAWRILTGPGPEPASVYAAASPAQPRGEGWAHLIDGAPGGRAVGFGSPDFLAGGSGYRALEVTGGGRAAIAWRFAGGSRKRVRALYHHVLDPVPVSAATSPVAMLHPLQVSLPEGWHSRCRAGRAAPDP